MKIIVNENIYKLLLFITQESFLFGINGSHSLGWGIMLSRLETGSGDEGGVTRAGVKGF
jgi:hypothetical protein